MMNSLTNNLSASGGITNILSASGGITNILSASGGLTCISVNCADTPSLNTPNGLCCKNHYNSYRFEKPKECAVCMDELSAIEIPLLCGHWFHKNCIINCPQLNCPVCRTQIKLSDGDYKQWREKHKSLIDNRFLEFYNVVMEYIVPDSQINNTIYEFSLHDVPFEHIRELLPFSGRRFRHSMLPEITSAIASVYQELNFMANPEAHVLNVLVSRGYSM